MALPAEGCSIGNFNVHSFLLTAFEPSPTPAQVDVEVLDRGLRFHLASTPDVNFDSLFMIEYGISSLVPLDKYGAGLALGGGNRTTSDFLAYNAGSGGQAGVFTPEPGSALLAIGGSAIFGVLRRKRRA